MAKSTASLTINSDILSSTTNFTTISTLTNAGGAVGMTQAQGLSRKTTVSTAKYSLLEADEFTANKAHKVYIKNTETSTALYFTISIGDQILGLLYGGDWGFFPWAASDGTLATFTITLTNTWASGDTLTFDGLRATSEDTTGDAFVTLIAELDYDNWTVARTSAGVATFTARSSSYTGLIEEGTDSDDWVKTSSAGVNTVARGVTAVTSVNDVKITPSTTASHTLEYMLFNE